jgi:hypothetical protein
MLLFIKHSVKLKFGPLEKVAIKKAVSVLKDEHVTLEGSGTRNVS